MTLQLRLEAYNAFNHANFGIDNRFRIHLERKRVDYGQLLRQPQRAVSRQNNLLILLQILIQVRINLLLDLRGIHVLPASPTSA